MSQRPFRVLGVQQIAVGGRDKGPLRALWVGLLGLKVARGFRSEAENVDEDVLEFEGGGAGAHVDLMQPLNPERRPKVHEPALNHVGLWVDDLDAAHAWLSARGVRFTPGGIRTGAAGHRVCFIHPRPSPTEPLSGEGVLIELVQAPPDVIHASTTAGAPNQQTP